MPHHRQPDDLAMLRKPILGAVKFVETAEWGLPGAVWEAWRMGSWFLERTEFQTEMIEVGEMNGSDASTPGMDFTAVINGAH